MTVQNGYITLAEFKASLDISDTDTTDDSALELTIERASRSIDGYCGRAFYPERRVNYFDVPQGRCLDMGLYDCLEVVTLTNGSTGTLAASNYQTYPYNQTPFYEIHLKPTSGIIWESDTDSNPYGSISIDGVWGYRQNYARDGWTSVTTLGAALASDSSTAVLTAENSFVPGDLMKIDTEMMLVTASDTSGATITRAYNGTTAAGHLINAPVYRFTHEQVVKQAALLQAQRYWKRKDAPFGVAGVSQLGQAVAISAIDPDITFLLDPARRLF